MTRENSGAPRTKVQGSLPEAKSHSANSYLRGIRRLIRDGGDPRKVRSVASVFVSRIDTAVDAVLPKGSPLRGKAALANSAAIYERYRDLFFSRKFDDLKESGVNVQRVLWGSTGTKNPDYSDIKYVSGLIARDTVNTLPLKTLEAFLDHGESREALTPENFRSSLEILKELDKAGVSLEKVCAGLLEEGVTAFVKSYDSLLTTLDEKISSLCKVKA